MLRFDKPVPGKDTDARTPESRAFSVNWNGPSLIDLVNDLMPRSVMLNPATVLSKLIGDLSVICFELNSQLKIVQFHLAACRPLQPLVLLPFPIFF